MNKMVAVFDGQGWFVTNFKNVVRGNRVILLDDSECRVVIAEPYWDDHKEAWTLVFNETSTTKAEQ